MNDVLVSVVITTKNRKDLLLRAIDSVRNQTYKEIEIIVVDDASTDGTKEICENMDDLVYVYIPLNESKGGNYARNLGIKTANGEYIAFLDDDDYWEVSKIQKQSLLLEDSSVGVVYCGMRREIINKDDSITYSDKCCDLFYEGDVSKKILTRIFTTTSAIMVRKDLLMQVGLFDENLRFWQEYELSIRLAQITNFKILNECLLIYRINKKDKQRLTNKLLKWFESVKYIYRKHKSLYKKLSLKEHFLYYKLILKEIIARIKNSLISNL